jgi:hypothetical protein
MLLLVASAALGAPSSGDDTQFSFSAPAGWRLRPEGGRYAYTLRQVASAEPSCSVGVGRELTGLSARTVQDATIKKFDSTLAGPQRPVIRRSILRSRSGVPILRADVVYSSYAGPGRGRGDVWRLRQVIYTFRRDDAGYVYNLVCHPAPHSDSFFDRALDAMARTIVYSAHSPKASNQAMQPTTGRRTTKFSMTRTSPPAATRALASGG